MRMSGARRYGELAMNWACGLAVFAAVAAACMRRGFFFAGEMYGFLTVWFALCAVLALSALVLYAAAAAPLLAPPVPSRACSILLAKCSAVHRPAGGAGKGGVEKEAVGGTNGSSMELVAGVWKGGITKTAMMLLPGCSFVICILYGVHALRGPLSSQDTMDEILRWALYASFVLFALYAAGIRRGGILLAAVWHLTGLVLSLSALLAVCGGLPVPYMVAYTQSPEVSVTGARLAGLLQYPNTFGAVMAVFLLERLFAAAYGIGMERVELTAADGEVQGKLADSEKRAGTADGGAEGRGELEGSVGGDAEGRERLAGIVGGGACAGLTGRAKRALVRRAALWRHAARLLPLFPYAAALLLSESRGAWLAAACAGAAALLWKRQLTAPLLLAGAAPVAAAALLYRQLARTGLAVAPMPGLLLLAGLWAGALLAGLWLHRRSCRAAGGLRAAMLMLAAAGWTAAGSAVLMHVRARLTGPSTTAGARVLFYRDAWKLAAEAPWLGRGGGTWRQSYLAAQSRPYAGSQVHSGYLDILLNLGMAGLLAVLLMMIFAGWLIYRTSPRLLPPLLVIALHAAVDFDWSYGLMWLLFFLLPALALAAAMNRTDTNPEAAVLPHAQPAHSPAAAVMPHAQPARPPAATVLPYDFPAHPPAGAGRQLPENIPTLTASRILQSWKRWMNSAFILACGLSVICTVFSFQSMRGAALYKQAAGSPSPAIQAELLWQSLGWNPRAPQTAVALSHLLAQEQGTTLLLRSLEYSPGNAALHWAIAERYLQAGDPGEALVWIRRSLQRDRFNAARRLAAIEGMLELGERGLVEGDKRRAADGAAAGLALLRQYRLLARIEEGKGPQHNDRGFGAGRQAEGLDLRLRNLQAKLLFKE